MHWACPRAGSAHHLFLPQALLRGKATQLGWEHKSFGHKEKEMEANEDLKLPSFLSPCKSTPVRPGCAHRRGFDWNLSLT